MWDYMGGELMGRTNNSKFIGLLAFLTTLFAAAGCVETPDSDNESATEPATEPVTEPVTEPAAYWPIGG